MTNKIHNWASITEAVNVVSPDMRTVAPVKKNVAELSWMERKGHWRRELTKRKLKEDT